MNVTVRYERERRGDEKKLAKVADRIRPALLAFTPITFDRRRWEVMSMNVRGSDALDSVEFTMRERGTR